VSVDAARPEVDKIQRLSPTGSANFRQLCRVGTVPGVRLHPPASLLAHLKGEFELCVFMRQCEEAHSFSRYFWWALNPKE
jgi:hypothetical protein